MAKKTDDHIDAALAKHPWTDRPREKYAQHLAKANGRRTSREWAEGIIERANTGDPAWAAWIMVYNYGSSREQAEGVLERANTGDPAWAACRMVLKLGSSREWAERVLERAKQSSNTKVSVG